MATFWGAKLKPRKAVTVTSDELDGRLLHISQATLGMNPKKGERSIVKCRTGDGPAVFICSLKDGTVDSIGLNLYFQEDVTFTVSGNTPVHLCGYYEVNDDDDDDDYSEDCDDDDYNYVDDGFIVSDEGMDLSDPESDEESDEDLVRRSSSVKLVEITGDDDAKAEPKLLTDGAKEETKEKPEDKEVAEESEDEDGFNVGAKRKASAGNNEPKKKMKSDDAQTPGEAKTPDTPAEGKKKKKKNKKTPKKESSDEGVKTENGDGNTEKSTEKKLGKSGKKGKKFPNGLEIQDLKMGKPDGKQAKPGKKVSIHYIGKLVSNGKIFDSTVMKRPFEFRLGVNEVVKGFDVGVAGMRVGDKRRVIIPPSMGYGAKSVGPIPPNSWLSFEIELVDVKG